MLKKIVIPSLLALMAVGCESSSKQALHIHRDHSDQKFTANFDRVYFSQAIDGQLDVILLADGAGDASVDRPLTTKDDQSVRQVVHMRVLWQHPRGLRIDNPSASNGMINWHVVASPSDRLTYSGSCWVRVSVDGDEAELDIRNANVAIRQMVGHIDDPLKRATIAGEVIARRSDATVRSYLEELATLARRDEATAAREETPAEDVTTP